MVDANRDMQRMPVEPGFFLNFFEIVLRSGKFEKKKHCSVHGAISSATMFNSMYVVVMTPTLHWPRRAEQTAAQQNISCATKHFACSIFTPCNHMYLQELFGQTIIICNCIAVHDCCCRSHWHPCTVNWCSAGIGQFNCNITSCWPMITTLHPQNYSSGLAQAQQYQQRWAQ